MASDPTTFPDSKSHRLLNLLKFVFAPLMFLVGPCVVSGREKLPREGGVIVIINHLSDSDPMIVQNAASRGIHFMSKSELFDIPVLKLWMRFWGAFPVKRGAPDRASLRLAAELAKSGRVVGIFPEGKLSEDGKLQEIREGAALIVRLAKVPVICLGIRNTDRIIPYGSLIPRPAFRRVTANWGEPKLFSETATNEEIAAWMESELRRLIPEPKSNKKPLSS
jgi:1-acyl-sn-glycerol-3-phosphate acyltransferase